MRAKEWRIKKSHLLKGPGSRETPPLTENRFSSSGLDSCCQRTDIKRCRSSEDEAGGGPPGNGMKTRESAAKQLENHERQKPFSGELVMT